MSPRKRASIWRVLVKLTTMSFDVRARAFKQDRGLFNGLRCSDAIKINYDGIVIVAAGNL